MNIKTYDWTGKALTSATINTAKARANTPIWVTCSPTLFNTIAKQGFGIRQYNPPRPLKDSLVEIAPAMDSDCLRDGDLTWRLSANMNPDMLIPGNPTETHIFYGIGNA